MESVIEALLKEGVSADHFLSFVTEYGIQDDAYIQETLNQLVLQETSLNRASPRPWTSAEADDLLEMLRTPEKHSAPTVRPILNEVDTNAPANIQPGAETHQLSCDQCNKTFTEKRNLIRHVKSAHNNLTFSCSKCHKTFTRQTNLRQHETTCRGIITFPCDQCSEILKTARELQFHQKIKHKIQTKRPREATSSGSRAKRQRQSSPQPGSSSVLTEGPSNYKCRQCPAQFPNRQALHAHHVQAHYQTGAGLHPEPFQQGQEPWVSEDGIVYERLRDCYRTNRALILKRYREGPVESLYNIPMFPGEFGILDRPCRGSTIVNGTRLK